MKTFLQASDAYILDPLRVFMDSRLSAGNLYLSFSDSERADAHKPTLAFLIIRS